MRTGAIRDPHSYAPQGSIHSSWALRAFATSASDGPLLAALKAEIEHEEEEYEAAEDITGGPPAGFSLSEQPGTLDAVLRKTFNGEDICVAGTFAPEDAFGEEDEEAEGEGEGEEEPERLTPLTVRVTVTKKADQPALEIDCVVDGNSWIIQDVRLNDPSVPDEGIPYGGPAFATLDESLQEQFDLYLQRRGLSALLAAYMRRYLEDKEQREYMRWLKRMGSFVAQQQ